MKKKVALSGDRPTGPLHVGHYVGSLRNRLKIQNECKLFVMIADVQALTDNYEHPEKLSENIFEVACDYLAIGIDPKITTIFIQSMIPEIAELTVFYSNLVTLARLQRNPTVKDEIQQKGFGSQIPTGFFIYPISQAADITIVNADLVPVGADQKPMVEQTVDIVRSFNRLYGQIFVEPQAIIPSDSTARLPGIDGKAKMSKSLRNAIYLSDSADIVQKKIMSMYTDPGHLKVEDPGKIEGNTVFTYLDTFDSNKEKVQELKEHYQKGGLGDVAVKKYLNEVMQTFLEPIRKRRGEFYKNPDYVMQVLKEGTAQAKAQAEKTMSSVKKAMKINYFE